MSNGLPIPASAQMSVRFAYHSDMQKQSPAEFKARDQNKVQVSRRANLSAASVASQTAVRAQTSGRLSSALATKAPLGMGLAAAVHVVGGF